MDRTWKLEAAAVESLAMGGSMDEPKIFEILIEATGLPKDSIQRELTAILEKKGLKPEDATLDDLREVIAHYLQDALVEAKQEHAQDA